MARSRGDTFGRILPAFARHRIHWYNWGLYACDANWSVTWNRSALAPHQPWFHEVLHPDGTPYDWRDLELIRRFRFAAPGEDHDPGIEVTDRWLKERAWQWVSLGPVRGIPANGRRLVACNRPARRRRRGRGHRARPVAGRGVRLQRSSSPAGLHRLEKGLAAFSRRPGRIPGTGRPARHDGWNRLQHEGASDAELCAYVWGLSDVLSFDGSQGAPETGWLLAVANRYGRPVICTRWAPRAASSAEETLRLFSLQNVRWYAASDAVFDAETPSRHADLIRMVKQFRHRRTATPRQ